MKFYFRPLMRLVEWLEFHAETREELNDILTIKRQLINEMAQKGLFLA